jgi:prepilin-type N-terminal cleavage/methylation domain-containing protein
MAEMRKPKGFSLIELLIVVAIILIIAAIAIPNLMRAKMAANDSSAAAGERTIVTGEIGYAASYPTIGYAASLITLGGVAPCTPSSSGACLIDQNLATNGNGNATTTSTKGKSGYQFAAAPGTNAVTQFFTTATPTSSTTGTKYYCAVEDGMVRSTVSAGGTTPIVNTACYTTSPLAN